MLEAAALKSFLSRPDACRRDKLLALLVADDISPKTVQSLKANGVALGLREITRWNVSDELRRSGGCAIRVSEGWEITHSGLERLGNLHILIRPPGVMRVITGLRKHLASVADPERERFLAEAVSCLEAGQFRAAIVLAWVGAAWVLQKHVFDKHLSAFNTEAVRRDSSFRPIKIMDDFGKTKEHDFLQIVAALSIVGKNVKQQLEHGLTLRNGCGHPNSMVIGENTAASHVEILMANVFDVF